jgi:hypothetical protein
MLEAEIDVFSGMPNPTFELSEKEEQELLDRIVSEASQMSPVVDPTKNFGLGYRGFVIRLNKTDAGPWAKSKRPKDLSISNELAAPPGSFPIEFRLGVNPATGDSAADWLLKISERKRLAISDEVREVLQQGVKVLAGLPELTDRPPEADAYSTDFEEAEIAPRGATWWACNSAFYAVNHEVFNRPEYVTRNNCYCFASNVLANVRYALPGRRGGRPATSITCAGVIDGLRADGWIDGCQSNTLTIAMVIWPNVDYHFYRVVTGGPDWWWEHKPGGTPARWTDDSNQPLFRGLAPINCNRGPYEHFCGYFYQNNDTAFVA